MRFDAPHDEPDDKEHEYHKQDKIDYVTHSIPPPQVLQLLFFGL